MVHVCRTHHDRHSVLLMHTVMSAYVQLSIFLVRLLFKCGFYLRVAYMQIPESAKPVNAVWQM